MVFSAVQVLEDFQPVLHLDEGLGEAWLGQAQRWGIGLQQKEDVQLGLLWHGSLGPTFRRACSLHGTECHPLCRSL